MAKKCPKCEECPAGEKWAVPFADFLSLLLALFIALYALASVNIEKQIALKEEFMKIYDMNTESQTLAEPQEDDQVAKTNEETDGEQEKESKAQEILAELNEMEENQAKGGNLVGIEEGTMIAIPANLLFRKGQATLDTEYSLLFLQKIARILTYLPEDTELNVKGFSDEGELNTQSQYRDALDLSTARANNVIRELIRYKVPKERLFSSGYGGTKSITTSNDQNTSQNRRVEFEVKTIQQNDTSLPDIEQTIFGSLKNEKY